MILLLTQYEGNCFKLEARHTMEKQAVSGSFTSARMLRVPLLDYLST